MAVHCHAASYLPNSYPIHTQKEASTKTAGIASDKPKNISVKRNFWLELSDHPTDAVAQLRLSN